LVLASNNDPCFLRCVWWAWCDVMAVTTTAVKTARLRELSSEAGILVCR
jgi:hypothetical protein